MKSMFCLASACVVAVAMGIAIAGTDPPPTPGRPHPIPSNDSHLLPAVDFAAGHVNQYCNCVYCQTLLGVTNATAQVVSGFIFAFSMHMQESEKCKLTECFANVTTARCPPDPNAKPYWCDAKVLAKPWENPPYTLQNLTCLPPDVSIVVNDI